MWALIQKLCQFLTIHPNKNQTTIKLKLTVCFNKGQYMAKHTHIHIEQVADTLAVSISAELQHAAAGY